MRRRSITWALAAAAFALALLQRPGDSTSDTKIDLHVDPVGFLSDAAAVWNPSNGLGQVQGGQYGGYLWPMGPFFALGNLIGLPEWLIHRLWLGLLLALAVWGAVRLLETLMPDLHESAYAVAGLLVLLNPYVVVFSNRTSVTLLGYAALPWLILVVHRGLRVPRGWWWPAAFALIVTSTGGGVNAAVTAFTLVGPLLLVAYELLTGGVTSRALRLFALRCALLSAPAWLWWMAPAAVHAAYGIDFLQFTEQPGAIWGTTSLSESLRLMGYWISYLGVGFGSRLEPYFSDSPTMLFDLAVVVPSLLVPALALAGYAVVRRRRYGPFLLLLVLAGLLVMFTGFPPGTPFRRALTFTYNHVDAVQFLRTTYKAGPLVALGLACLGGVGFAWAWGSLRAAPLRAALAVVVLALATAAAWPLVSGRALDSQMTWHEIPPAWEQAADGLDRELPSNSRALVLPGQLFAFYDWGGTVDPILPSLTERRVAVRNVPPYMDLHATDLLWTVDALVQQGRLTPGGLSQLLFLLSAGVVVTGTDDREERSGAVDPAAAERNLSLGPPRRAYGPTRPFTPELGEPVPLPQVRRHDVPGAPGVVRVERGPPLVVDGSADTLVGVAALGELRTPFLYAGDVGAGTVRGAAQQGGGVVIGDGNRRRTLVVSRSRQTASATLDAGADPSEDAAVLDPFDRGSQGQTVAAYSGGVSYVRAPYNPGFSQFPEHRPFAALDGDVDTFWLADPVLEDTRRYVDIGFDRPRDVERITLVPAPDRRARVTRVSVNGREFDMGRGPTPLRVGLRGVRKLRVAITEKVSPAGRSDSAGGFAEIRIPGVRARELLRPPVLAETALRGADLDRSPLSYVFTRTTGDDPFRRGPDGGRFLPGADDRAEAEPLLARFPGDAEEQIARRIAPPAERRWRARALVNVAADARDSDLDRLVGHQGARFESSGRFRGLPRLRASSAFDGDPQSAWIAPWSTGMPAWVEVNLPSEVELRTLRLVRAGERVRFPTRVIVRSDGGATTPRPVAPDGTVSLGRAIRGRRFRLEIEEAGPPRPGAVGEEARAVGVAEVRMPGVEPALVPREGLIGVPCGALEVRTPAGPVRLKPIGRISELDSGLPLRAEPCGRPVELPAASVDLETRSRLFRPYHLELASPAPQPAAPDRTAGRVLSAGTVGRGRVDDVLLRAPAGSWLVLGEAYNEGWRAWCDDRALGEPRVLDGYANAWLLERDCATARFAWAPQRAVDWIYIASGLFCLGLLVFLLVASRRRGGTARWLAPLRERPVAPLPVARAAAWALAGAAVVGFVFALRAGAVAAPLLFLILWRGVPTRALVLAAAGLLAVVVPAIYLLFPADDHGGYNGDYAIDLIGAHWVAVAGFVLLAIALLRDLVRPVARAVPEQAGQRPEA